MKLTERTLTFAGLALALYLGGSAYFATAPNAAVAGAGRSGGVHAEPKASTVAVVDTYRIAVKLMDTARFKDRIEGKRKEWADKLAPLEKNLDELANKLRAMGPEAKGPEAETTAREFETKRQEYGALRQQAEREMDSFVAGVNFDAFKQVVDSAAAIADKKGYSLVLSSRGTGPDEMKAPDSSGAFVQSLLARPVIKSATADDITADVIADLKLE